MRYIRQPKSPASESSIDYGWPSPVIVGLFDGNDIDAETEINDIIGKLGSGCLMEPDSAEDKSNIKQGETPGTSTSTNGQTWCENINEIHIDTDTPSEDEWHVPRHARPYNLRNRNIKHTSLDYEKLRRKCNGLAGRDRQLRREVASLRREVASLKSSIQMNQSSKREQRKIQAYCTIINIQAKLIKSYEENSQLKVTLNLSDTDNLE